ncbi:2OG-Fe(II) oxygenase [Microbulbifer sp. 2205BS26-8]|uniref:2OG-Fe(II)-dependent halogenase WelO5 family protein n=1 Tax=Microbulbifer sp. 2205BS26-8 TaxID=3064386 RepID=UPI002740049E|nr:2OG-Fe(II) oxygenase [Microbulbifer sp. 2205BS26-8]MDP5211249.1 2OG-Fe(II) oxygenase [Microbulbifer sp. 2205BS26-8]
MQEKFKILETLTQDHLLHLFKRDYIVIRIPNFYHPNHCSTIAQGLLQEIDPSSGSGIYLSNIDSFWAASRDSDRQRRYFERGSVLQDHLRQISSPFPSPIDLLCQTLCQCWSMGAKPMSMLDMPAPFGISRLWPEGSEGLPHQDLLNRELKDHNPAIHLKSQIGVNIFLTNSHQGGELEIWDKVIKDSEYEQFSDTAKGSYGYKRDILPKESITITPKVGDLILINTACIHAIRKVVAGQRLTISGFVGKIGDEHPLIFWS